MSTNTEQEQPVVETPSTVSNETENLPAVTTEGEATVAKPTPVVEESKSSSSWFTNLGIPPNLTSQLTNLSSSFMQVTFKVSAAANTLVQKTLPQRPSTPTETEEAVKAEEKAENEQTSEDNTEGTNKDLTSKDAMNYCIKVNVVVFSL